MTDTLAGDARRNVVFFSTPGLGIKPKFRFAKRPPTEDGLPEQDMLVVEDLAVFRSGHFYDSMGFEHNWENIHIDQMVANHNLLKTQGIFADVPVRKGHPSFLGNNMDGLIGYHTGLKSEKRTNPVDGEEYLYLLATYEITDPDAIKKISSGLWRHVSSEVGGWLSNSATEFWPVYQGVAYVDIPAVEGLKGFNSHNGVGTTFSIMSDNEEAPVPDAPATSKTAASGSTVPATTPASPAVSFQTADPAAFARSQFTFTVGGQQTQDFAAVQAHITTLETAATEARETNRKEFIKSLSEGPTPKILASQIGNVESYALKMDDDGWKAFRESWGEVNPVAAVSQHANGTSTNHSGTTPAGGSTEPTEIETLAAVVQQHRRSGMSQAAIEKTASFGKLKAADATHSALSA